MFCTGIRQERNRLLWPEVRSHSGVQKVLPAQLKQHTHTPNYYGTDTKETGHSQCHPVTEVKDTGKLATYDPEPWRLRPGSQQLPEQEPHQVILWLSQMLRTQLTCGSSSEVPLFCN